MTDQPKSFSDIMLEASKLAFSLHQIARKHPEAEWTQYPGDLCGERTWAITELAAHLSAIHTVMGVIAEAPNGYINREALDSLQREFEPAVEFLESPWAKGVIDEINSRLA